MIEVQNDAMRDRNSERTEKGNADRGQRRRHEWRHTHATMRIALGIDSAETQLVQSSNKVASWTHRSL